MNEKALSDLIAQNDIRRLISAYCDAVRLKDARAAGRLFAPDAYVRVAHLPERHGREAIVAGMSKTFESFSFLHQRCDTGLIDVQGDHANARLGVQEANRRIDQEGMQIIFGIYEDEYSRLDEGWRFQRRRFTMQFRAVLSAVEVQEFPPFTPTFEFSI